MIRLFNHYVSVTVLAVLFGDLLVLAGSFLVLFHLAVFSPSELRLMPGGGPALPVLVWIALAVFLFFQSGLYDTGYFEDRRNSAIRIASAFVVLSLSEWLLMAVLPQFRLGWKDAALLPLVSFLGISLWRLFLLPHIPIFRWQQRTLILGTFQLPKIFEELNKFRHNIRIHGVISPHGLMEFDLLGYATEHKIHSIVISLKDRRGTLPIQSILKCKMNGIDVVEWGTFYERNTNKIDIMNINPSHLILSDGFQKKHLTLFLKNLMDFVLALFGLIVFLPFGLLIALLIRLESPGPVFYTQERVGRNGKSFRIIKFRSMVADAEKGKTPQWASQNDPRITRVGRFLRNTRLDEVPQLINILKGEISFVGPRPERPFFVAELEKSIPFYSQRHVTKPGLSGWAQIRYRYGATVDDAVKKLEYDLYYIKNLSIFLDLMILLETVQVVLFRRGSR
ncbi:MAG: TIGR03013 family XrtA/PEP-CTERM system glycosyltransferase [Nitrospirota bacterium]|nr:TIGR03013 family XrtA/PEP-CTERM system glycosyltransferase [Nitrospirota bacterium]